MHTIYGCQDKFMKQFYVRHHQDLWITLNESFYTMLLDIK